MAIRTPDRSDSPAGAASPGPAGTRRASRLLGAAGVLGALGGMSCGVTMLLPVVGLAGLAGAGTAAGTEAGTMAGMGSGPAPGGFLGLLARIGPELLAVSALLVVVSLAMRRRTAAVPAAVGGAVLYWGMYAQGSGSVMYATLATGFVIWLGSWAWARSAAPAHSCAPAAAGAA